MQFKNSYIFLRRKTDDKSEKTKIKDNVIEIDRIVSFKELLEASFTQITFNPEDNTFDAINNGTIKVEFKDKEYEILFQYHNVWDNYYLDIMYNTRSKYEAIEIQDNIKNILIGKGNSFEEIYVSIVSYDCVSEYYCNKLFPYLNEFERKLRKMLLLIYTLNFNLDYYIATTSIELQEKIKENSRKIKEKNTPKSDCYIKYGFYSLDYSDIDKLLFTKYTSDIERNKLEEFLRENNDLSKLSDSDIRNAFKLLEIKSDWDRFFGDKKIDKNFQGILNEIRIFRNNIAHCKFVSEDQYNNCLNLLKKSIKSLDKAIQIVEEKEFFEKNVELIQKSFDGLEKLMNKMKSIYNPILESLDLIAQPLKSINDRLFETIKSINSIKLYTPNIVLPEIELPKYDIPKFFDKEDEIKTEENS